MAELVEPAQIGYERELLSQFLNYYRSVVVRKLEGLDRGAAGRPGSPPSQLALSGIVKHLARVEDIWFQKVMDGSDVPEPWRSAPWRAVRVAPICDGRGEKYWHSPRVLGERMTSVTSEAVEEGWLFHLALADEWSAALDAGLYERSTIGVSLAEQGFIHCSYEHQVQTIADILYRGRTDVVLLRIDRDRVEAEVRVENLDGGTDLFPHIYGPLPAAAVVGYDEVPTDVEGRLMVQALLSGA